MVMMKTIRRIFRHLSLMPWQVRRSFSSTTLDAIEVAITSSEAAHSGELRFIVEGSLPNAHLYQGQSPRARALDVFGLFKIWDTEHRNGVLIYLLMADRAVEIVVDRGILAKVKPAEWEIICQKMEAAFREGQYQRGAIEGIQAVTDLLKQHFPANKQRKNELPNAVLIL
jgi:uncharacterized membrane protein